LAAGFDYYITKPVNFDQVLNLLRDLCGTAAAPPEVVEPHASAWFARDGEGIDFMQALRNHNNDEDLLIRLMGQFVHIYENADDQMREHLQASETEKAERLAHNLAGVAGSFGAVELMNSARNLEHKIANEEMDLADDLGLFANELHKLVMAIQEVQTAMQESMSASGSS
ncbi:MAG: response regulator, partial [Pseudomonadales bacterium]|nr:response regulator [Pseudomonadales bacterium]